jgi:magnesium chelatase family protein
MTARQVRRHCRLDAAAADLLRRADHRLDLSARAHHRVLKVARTIADLAGRGTIASQDIAEALDFRGRSNGIAG